MVKKLEGLRGATTGVDNNIVQYYHIEKLLKIIAIYRYWVVINIEQIIGSIENIIGIA